MNTKRNLKKGAVLLLALVPTLVGAACDNTNSGKTKITIGMWPEKNNREDVEMFTKWKDAFELANPEYIIEPQPYIYRTESIGTDFQAKALPVVFQTWFTEPEMLISKRIIRDITDQLDSLGWTEHMDEGMKKIVSNENGRVFGVPRDGYGLGMALNLNVLYDNEIITKNPDGSYNLFDESGSPLYPTTFAELMDMGEILFENESLAKGFLALSANKQGGWQFSNIAWNFGAQLQIKQPDGKYKANLNDPKAVQALQWIADMAKAGYLSDGSSFNYSEWETLLPSGRVAAAFVGNDALPNAVTKSNMKKDDLAFVPIPAGPGGDQHALFGGTPFVFKSDATDAQVLGALKFMEYMGRSPEVSEVSLNGLELGAITATAKGIPILPTIKPWTNKEYIEAAEEIEDEYVNVNMDYYGDFFNTIGNIRHAEEPLCTQDMYEKLDIQIQSVLANKGNVNCLSLLTTANNQFQKILDEKQ